MQTFHEALTFDDVLLLPRFSKILPKDVSLKTQLTRTISLNTPILSAAMDTVTEHRLAVCLAEEGGLGILHKNMSIEAQAYEVRKVKKFESGVVKDPITVTPNTTIRELIQINEENNISGMPVVEGKNLVGIVTSRDIRFENNFALPVSQVMTPKSRLITVKEGASRDTVMNLFRQHRVEKILIVNDRFELCGMYTVKDILKSQSKPLATKTDSGQLRVGAAVTTGAEMQDRVSALIAEGVDLIVVDTAHGHSQGVLDTIRWIKKHYPHQEVMGGNIATADAAVALMEAGADAIKVGMGPGSICTTRIVAGIGVPQLTAILNVVVAAKKKQIPIVADGGIRFSGDLCKAIAAGAACVMIGGLFAGTEEAPGEVVLYQGRSYKAYRGMGSVGAMSSANGSHDRYFQEKQPENIVGKYVPEGIEGRVPYKGPLPNVLHQLTGGLRSCMGYLGADSVEAMQHNAEFIRITNAGVRESHVHDVKITKEAPNYSREE
ncbi:MAG: IMP dehydrogenase [Gammaproteobacteria bacterium RIFCSPLOWO2_02_FULL_42_14]|nr:MAG: IMP dehydrogenase [Gammaproteobacteria bacterium RIFCSPHIGHO2_02_FULL_42_43]OGT27953.1 MAG: IMP dehydrogenase [Gammaproteobacteria bacterium RIFCSPHIGHO2_01_FULL_42_8]OGT50965.1 MAG: IMP dehydrogenase [Gammaproteobacteria bacterium RIFCSPHIGHO2_12_FULL_41_25]OGT63061.1 MAG: IMP dehydrogenase [Gammaproteobacteria bacterium RIFCSPLOWO2_02_FULL_42_14]OGT85646.1 MAG: IMP dehydrogenase [Gammaproteobacteria bacterium RIFCSPLOWO2_12_FULL_42_18]